MTCASTHGDHACISVALLACLLVVGAPVAAHDDAAGHIHLFVMLGDDPATTAVEPDDELRFRFEGALVAEATDDGVAVRMSLPDGASVQRFTATNHSGGMMHLDDTADPAIVALVWEEGGPTPGETVPGVRLEAVRTIDLRTSTQVRWAGLGDFNETTVRVEIPTGMTLTSGGDLVRNIHGASNRALWSQIDLDKPVLEFSVRQSFSGEDPARSEPPNPAAGWLILLGIVLVTGGAWALGKRLENRRND